MMAFLEVYGPMIGVLGLAGLLLGIVGWFLVSSGSAAARERPRRLEQPGGGSAQYATGRSMSREDEEAWCKYMKEHLREQGFSEAAIERAADQGRLAAVSGMFHDATPEEMPMYVPPEMPGIPVEFGKRERK